MKNTTKISLVLIAIGAVLLVGAPSVAAAAWTPPPAEQEPALPAEGVEALTWTDGGWTLTLSPGASEAKMIEPAQEILCGANYGKPCGTTYRLSSTAPCVMVQVDWPDGRHNSTDPWRCRAVEVSPTSSPTPTESSQPSVSPTSTPSPTVTPTPSASPEPSPTPEPSSSSPTPTTTPSPEASTSTPSTPTSTPTTTASASSSAPVASAPAPSVPRSSELARTGGPSWIGAIPLLALGVACLVAAALVSRKGRRR